MKRKIRRGTFETNSSSTHAICITKSDMKNCDLPKHVTFTHGEFGWEDDEYSGVWKKASYLYQAIYDRNEGDNLKEYLDKITKLLSEKGITCDFESDSNKEWGNGYIDHSEDAGEFISYVLKNSDNLVKYLFGDSFIITGNDNSDEFKDRMYINEGEEETSYGTFTNYGGLKPEFDNYIVIEKGN